MKSNDLKLKMSDAIELGALSVRETRDWGGCAVATAYKAKTGRCIVCYAYSMLGETPVEAAAWEFDMPYEVVAEASSMHSNGQSREQVAAWLRSRGY